jgi:hypothetical protein
MRHLLSLFCFIIIIIIFSCKHNEENKKKASKANAISSKYSCYTPEVMDKLWYSSGKKAPLLKGLEGIYFPVSTKNLEAQKYFDQGLMLSFGFNHAEAARSFYEATKQDSTCAMGWWGFAYVLGPSYNAGMEKDNFQRAYDAVQKAKFYSKSST